MVTLDEDFGNDLEEIIARHQREPWNPPLWDYCWTPARRLAPIEADPGIYRSDLSLYGPLDLSLSPVTGPVHPVTNRTAWLVGLIESLGCVALRIRPCFSARITSKRARRCVP
jgi:hypothetical protein